MFTSTSNADLAEAGTADVLIPLIRAAATIGFAIAPCSLGFVIIAVSEQLIRSIMVGDDPEMLVSDLQNQFPNAAIEVIENYDAGLVAKVVDLIERPDQALDLPLDIRGTDFQMRVWDALQKVPTGSTVNYTFLAEQIGVPNAVRAAACACAVNYLPVG
jgi:AraC family transcriptional regulator of adaptative response/methylated-DNA-[protein]-cysteine methyltransferase